MVLYIWELENNAFKRIAVIDDAVSVIWARAYNAPGNFEVYMQATTERVKLFTEVAQLFITRESDSTVMMYVEKVEITTDPENGNYMTISGRGAECLLGMRIVPAQWNFSGRVENGIRQLINENIISPSASARQIPFIQLGQNVGLETSFTKQITGKNLLDAVSEMCKAYNLGFKFIFTGSGFLFQMYRGSDRSYNQTDNSYVVFSPEYENLANTTYTNDKTTSYNAAYVAGEGEGTSRIIVDVQNPQGKTGIDRREIWLDARNTSTNDGEISPITYANILYTDGFDQLDDMVETKTFEGETIDPGVFEAFEDYDLGDTVQIENAFGLRGTAIVQEITEVEDESGYRRYPTLSEWSVT